MSGEKRTIMNFFNKQKQTLFLAAAAVTVFASMASAQYDTALVPFIVNVAATVSATDGATQRQISVTANQEATLRLPIQKTSGTLNGAQRQANSQVTISNLGGKVSVSLPAQSYKSAEVLLCTANGKRILRYGASAAGAVNSVTRPNLATGVYLLTVKGTEGNAVTSRLTHSGGDLNINVAFGGESRSSDKRLSKEAANGDWTITVSATGYVDSVYTLHPVVGSNTRQTITLRAVAPAIGVPENVTVTAASATSVIVNWSAVAGATGYRVYRSTTASGAYSPVANTTSTSFTNSGLTSGTTYYYKVTAYTNAGEGTQSAYVSVTTVPSVPTNVTASTSSGNVVVSWAQVTGATGYYVYRGATASGAYSRVTDVTSASYTDAEVSPGTSYYYKVSAYTSGGESSQSSYISVTAPLVVPAAPANVTATKWTKTSISVGWSAVSGATRYFVCRSTTSDGNFNYVLGDTYNTGYLDTGLTEGATYYYKVSAANSVGTGPQSAYAYETAGSWPTDIFTDTRDDKTYKTAVVGGVTWMVQNLNFATSNGSWCRNNTNCSSGGTCGRLYDLSTAQVVCPAGWHLPSKQEWEAGIGYKAISVGIEEGVGAATCDFRLYSNGTYSGTEIGLWWLADGSFVYYDKNNYCFNCNMEIMRSERNGYSVRCIAN